MLWPSKDSTDERVEARHEELQQARRECESLRQQNRELSMKVNNYLRKEVYMKTMFNKIRSETAQSRDTVILSDDTDVNAWRNREESAVYHEVINYVETLSHDLLQLDESLRREREILAKTKEEASAAAIHYQKVTSEMMMKLNSLQTHRQTLYDDQCASEWRKLQQALNVWTRRVFKDQSAMSLMTLKYLHKESPSILPPENMLQNLQGKRAYIQGIVVGAIFETVFNFFFAFSFTPRIDRFLSVVGKNVKRSGSGQTWETWRSVTSEALETSAVGKRRLEDACNELLQTVETLFSKYYSPDIPRKDVYEALHQIFKDCLAFKKKLEGQEFDYVIRQSPTGTVYSAEKMNSLNFIDQDGSIVQMSVWPSLYKVSFENEHLLIEPEVVWTKEPAHDDDAAMEDHSDTGKKTKQEEKAGGDVKTQG